MPSKAVAYGILREFRSELVALSETSYDDAQGLTGLAGVTAATPVLRRMKSPTHQWFTKRCAPTDLSRLIKLLDQLEARGHETSLGRQASASDTIHDLTGRRHYIGRWAEAKSIGLRQQLLERSTPYDLVADGISAISPVIPDWYWRLDPKAIEDGISVSDQLYHLEAISYEYSPSRTEALRRIGRLFGVKLHINEEAIWFDWLMGLEDNPWDEDGQRAQVCLNRLWWAQAAKLQARNKRPDLLPPVVPALQHDYRENTVSWIGDRPNEKYYPNVEIVCVDLDPSRAGIPMIGDSVELPRMRSGVIRSADYFENGNGYVVRAMLGVICKPR